MVAVVEFCVNTFSIRRPNGSYLNVAVPPERSFQFIKEQDNVYCVSQTY